MNKTMDHIKPTTEKVKLARAPAVTNALAVLEFLAVHPGGAGLSEIARGAGIGKSICYNVLQTMQIDSIVVKDERHATWKLGPRLIRLGYAARTSYPVRTEIRSIVRQVVDEYGLPCVVGQLMHQMQGVVVIDRVVPTKTHLNMILLPIGEVFPMTAPVLGRLFLASLTDVEASGLIGNVKGKGEKQANDIIPSLEVIRNSGFATSIGEYEKDVNAVGCRVGKGMDFAVCILGRMDDLPVDMIPKIGRDLAQQLANVRQWE